MWCSAFNFNNHYHNSTGMFIKHWTGCHIGVIFSKCLRQEFSPFLSFVICISMDADQRAATSRCKNRVNIPAEELQRVFSAQIIFLTHTETNTGVFS